jgi:hypothetical protein
LGRERTLMAFLVKGDQVSFVRMRDGHVIYMPPSHVMVHDVHGELARTCDLFIVPYAHVKNGTSDSDKSLRSKAVDYYGKQTPLETGTIDVPTTGWHRVAATYAIRYRRMGRHRGLYEHDFSELPWLEQSRDALAYKLPLPEGCVLNERGIVWP